MQWCHDRSLDQDKSAQRFCEEALLVLSGTARAALRLNSHSAAWEGVMLWLLSGWLGQRPRLRLARLAVACASRPGRFDPRASWGLLFSCHPQGWREQRPHRRHTLQVNVKGWSEGRLSRCLRDSAGNTPAKVHPGIPCCAVGPKGGNMRCCLCHLWGQQSSDLPRSRLVSWATRCAGGALLALALGEGRQARPDQVVIGVREIGVAKRQGRQKFQGGKGDQTRRVGF